MYFEAFLLVLPVTAAISSFLASLINSSDVFLYSNSVVSHPNVVVHLISKLIQDTQRFIVLTGIPWGILSDSAGLSNR